VPETRTAPSSSQGERPGAAASGRFFAFAPGAGAPSGAAAGLAADQPHLFQFQDHLMGAGIDFDPFRFNPQFRGLGHIVRV